MAATIPKGLLRVGKPLVAVVVSAAPPPWPDSRLGAVIGVTVLAVGVAAVPRLGPVAIVVELTDLMDKAVVAQH
jgi:hypothetical protein